MRFDDADDFDPHNVEDTLNRIRAQASSENIRVTQHAHQEMVEEDVILDEILEVL